jgi:hypothetical protein
MQTRPIVFAALALLICVNSSSPADEDSGLNKDGFITTWLMLAPISLEEGHRGAAALDEEQLKSEAQLRPQAGDKVSVGAKELTWRVYRAKEDFFDFNDFLGKETDDSVGYAVCYIHCSDDMKEILLKTGSDDQAKIYLNGTAVLKQEMDRPLETDEDTTEVTLRKGVNVFVFKVVNESEDWSGCARFMDKDGKVIKNFKVNTTAK